MCIRDRGLRHPPEAEQLGLAVHQEVRVVGRHVRPEASRDTGLAQLHHRGLRERPLGRALVEVDGDGRHLAVGEHRLHQLLRGREVVVAHTPARPARATGNAGRHEAAERQHPPPVHRGRYRPLVDGTDDRLAEPGVGELGVPEVQLVVADGAERRRHDLAGRRRRRFGGAGSHLRPGRRDRERARRRAFVAHERRDVDLTVDVGLLGLGRVRVHDRDHPIEMGPLVHAAEGDPAAGLELRAPLEPERPRTDRGGGDVREARRGQDPEPRVRQAGREARQRQAEREDDGRRIGRRDPGEPGRGATLRLVETGDHVEQAGQRGSRRLGRHAVEARLDVGGAHRGPVGEPGPGAQVEGEPGLLRVGLPPRR